jgi:hypothetical protein
MSERPERSLTKDIAHLEAEKVLYDIMASEQEIWRLKQHVKAQKEKLGEICPHSDVREEYDDDFHRPRSYVMCRLCGAEVV